MLTRSDPELAGVETLINGRQMLFMKKLFLLTPGILQPVSFSQRNANAEERVGLLLCGMVAVNSGAVQQHIMNIPAEPRIGTT